MEENGFTVKIENVEDLDGIKAQYRIPDELQSCHTAIVDGYVIEGHVPVSEVKWLLAERPDVIGIAVPGMPAGSPGMDSDGSEPEPYSVIAFDSSGNKEVVASYP